MKVACVLPESVSTKLNVNKAEWKKHVRALKVCLLSLVSVSQNERSRCFPLKTAHLA